MTELRPDPDKPKVDVFAPPDVDTEVPDETVPDDVTEDTEETPPADEPVTSDPGRHDMTQQTAPVSVLTDGTGVSPINVQKLLKDFVADALISGAAALAAAQIVDVGSAIQTPEVAAFAVAGALIHAGYRAVLRWATT